MSDEKPVVLPEYQSAISDVGLHKINIRGYPLKDIILKLTFTETIYLVSIRHTN